MENKFMNMKKIPPFRYDIVGSFLRTEEIKSARLKYKRGEITALKLKEIEDREILKLVEQEKAAGLKVVTDGEFRRSWWHLDFFEGISGIEKITLKSGVAAKITSTPAETVRIVDKIKFQAHPMLEHFKYLKSISGECTPKFTMPSPALLHFVVSAGESKVYKDEEELFKDIIEVYKDAIKAFYAAGCRYLQLDDTTWGTLSSEVHRIRLKNRGTVPEVIAKKYVDLINESIKDHPKDMIITLHVCRGNLHSGWFAAGSYEPVARELFSNARVDGFFLEYDSERSGGFEPLRFIKDQFVALGLVTTKHGGLESKEFLKSRIKDASKYVDIKSLCLSPQCGFASIEEGNIITEEEQWDKIKLVIETAKEVWKQQGELLL